MKSNKGFTLIELLAVIVILAIIALIATPLTLNVINDARTKADKNSAYGVLDAARLYYAEQLLKDNTQFGIAQQTVAVSALSISGDGPTNVTESGPTVTYANDGTITISSMKFKNGGCFIVDAGQLKDETCPTE